MGAIIIDSTFLIILALIVPILAFFGGFMGGKMQVPKVARIIGGAIKKGKPIMFLAGHDRKLRAIPMKAGLTGYLHDRDLEVIPDDKGTYNFYGTEGLIASAQCVSNINPTLLRVIDAFRKKQLNGDLKQMEDVLGKKAGTTPRELAECLYMMEERRKELEKRISFIKEVSTDQITMEEKIRQMGFDPDEEARYKTEMKVSIDEMKSGGLENTAIWKEYQKLMDARKITTDEDKWEIEEIPGKTKTDHKVYNLIRKAIVTLDDIQYFLPTGSSMNSIWTMTRRSEQANKLESAFTEAQGFKWMIIGLTIMMASIGIGVMVYLAVGK